MNSTLTIAAMGLVLALPACAQRPESAATTGRLNCPEQSGSLDRIEAAADGRSCRYRMADGAEVELRLIDVVGDARATLAMLETELAAALPAETADATPSATGAEAEESAALAAQAVAEAQADAGGDVSNSADTGSGAARVDVGDSRIQAQDDSVSINLPGLKIDAQNESANVRIGPVSINASDDGATVKIYREVRLKGEALVREKRGVRATYILAGEPRPHGAAYVGLEAGGPKTGPLTVAIVTSATAEADDESLKDVQKLVRENGGV
ncbi:hypothetical protein [Phenylobacterium sp.]|uniref:hypothetical protein n=1 Tax=Phenylobacterium sp. TaxID=1871053 RepID=UPI00272FDE3E|nr:hypothetical protein [Phenylobacterium sp.]MDP1619049.1 hypothetical protein [Phenylobacterium sp.]MDP1985964.1 hypothetical protein [Phenylobacterium sp.]